MGLYLNPPETCDLCKREIEDEFFDAPTTHGPWANMCPECHSRWGRYPASVLGTGRGQRFVRVGRSPQFMKAGS